MAISPKARPYLLVLILVLVAAGIVVAQLPGEEPNATRSTPDASTTPPVVDAVGGDGAGDAYYPQDGNTGYDVSGYDVSVTYDPATRQLDGVAKITATATADLTRFNLDLYTLVVE